MISKHLFFVFLVLSAFLACDAARIGISFLFTILQRVSFFISLGSSPDLPATDCFISMEGKHYFSTENVWIGQEKGSHTLVCSQSLSYP